MKKIIVANWKMHPSSLGEARALVESTDEHVRSLADASERLNIVVCPPFVFAEEVAGMLSTGVLADVAQLGAQDVAMHEEGAQTGEVGAEQLEKLGVRYVIAGHSDRRYKMGESDDVVNEKIRTILAHGMVPIVCVGEQTREGAWQDSLRAQVEATFRGMTGGQVAQCLIAYEPVWAISTSPDARPDTPASAVQSMALIRDVISDRFDASQATFLYGGSITSENVASFIERSEISGVLVGGASVRAEEFCSILSIVAQ
jgi:triosephosphate isomerase